MKLINIGNEIKIILLALWFLMGMPSHSLAIELANVSEAHMRNVALYPEIARNLINRRMFFTAIPFLKEYMTANRGRDLSVIDSMIDDVTTEVGVKQFEVLPAEILSRSSSPVIRYILAKKYFRQRKYAQALEKVVDNVPSNHPILPFVLQLRASIYSVAGNAADAIVTYKECILASKKQMGREGDRDRIRQLEVNRDYCIIGIPRTEFASGQYDSAYSNYLDLPKESPVWPEILFEEAWNSFYLRDYNRTLGKLVTYKAPVFEHIFNPEIDSLRALTYMEMCMWDDAKKVVEDFYAAYQSNFVSLEREYKRMGNNYQYYYNSAKEARDGVRRGNPLFDQILSAIVKDPIFIEILNSFQRGEYELNFIKEINNVNLKQALGEGVRDALLLQRDLIGAYVKTSLGNYLDQVDKTLQSMSYVKLEILGKKKESIISRPYGNESEGARERGDYIFLKRTDKQYFWDFIGEFWADELGDYVFALKSECEI
ncbi:MAG: hypothetical protein A2504_05480 [Bdellovibrionales bacterium RIFOXYD12_FULL_39_22]|nr:MAG: hypothetical protein A2385_06345 [Bdellovibrionales bacterium RIFOXYB1_FULL_39_21]OFZ41898.1 MAG: hypothetical protein A2485_08315 [Bdellovibrionales bacterium RIFOXYC12_FULL_39_17]OFZ50614.1 MAG: hypothetical protein A2404_05265 [Bdellovibrionales bacterium RIFOXYC1_FULL_39_130]OFZ71346.1 MAG: hypothetical protein A2451_05765 [Bdellovibrionales bacterium RIFOXYC2_FULL_39_8]OFZ77837.1 MAG: hypothetical protein A2560_00435 [Bdellovibrionales bacterium RIFOXYD1_FULL_39_84]OFZ93727.1 MAG: